ncbi:MAG: hypothetical protein AB8B54_03145 [Sphingorhabdus sp.]
MSEFHDLAELTLNREGQSWGNLGYWQSATDYSEAGRALAILLGEAAELDSQSVVFDAGFGCGDQLLLWLIHFHVAEVFGANLSRSQTAYAQNSLTESGHPKAAFAIVQGDINDPDVWSAALGENQPSHILALDCAYHFPSRLAFFTLADQHLESAGRLALTDFILSDQHDRNSFTHRILRWMLKKSHIAETNIVRKDIYLRQLGDAGFKQARLVDISEHVMPGFARYLRETHGASNNGKRLDWSGRVKYGVTGRFLSWAYHRSLLRYCVITAIKAG